MKTEECIRTRRSTRKFSTRKVGHELTGQVIEAGRYAPSGGNSQGTHFIVIESRKVLQAMSDLANEAFSAMELTEGMYPSLASSIRQAKTGRYCFHYNAPVLILTCSDRNYTNNIADCACALENMMLAANELDLGSCWINQLKWLNEDEKLLALERSLGMKDNERVYAALALGYPDTEDGLPARTPLPRHGNPVTWIEADEKIEG
jgi:nitroreductase